jgi:hypothetical protein
VEPRDLADGARWALVVVFGLAAAEKAETLLHRAAAWHPVILARARWRRHAAALIGAPLLADLAAVAALLIRPVSGAVLAAALVAVYSLAARGVHGSGGGDDCRCLWKVLRTRTWRGPVGRNLALPHLAAMAWIGRPEGSLEGAVLGALLLVLLGAVTSRLDRVGGPHDMPGSPAQDERKWVYW